MLAPITARILLSIDGSTVCVHPDVFTGTGNIIGIIGEILNPKIKHQIYFTFILLRNVLRSPSHEVDANLTTTSGVGREFFFFKKSQTGVCQETV